MHTIYLSIILSPLLGAIMAGFGGKLLGRRLTHCIVISLVALSCVLSLYVLYAMIFNGLEDMNQTIYVWGQSGGLNFQVGYLVDRLTALMMCVVTFVSLMVHIYTIGYMKDDAGYQRFFCYIALFTFAMLMLVMSNNFLQLFFGWEAVGVISYLLIGFWYKKETAIFANLKAFLVNRVGDFGFLLGIAAVLYVFNSLDYADVFGQVSAGVGLDQTLNFLGNEWSLMTFICIFLFIGAMGKSAQVPLHVWLPDSMEGPTPISALIHAATMVTAGIFMVARMSPLFELSETALTFVLVIGATTALFMGLLGIVQNDIKRVVAYSTLSQLGYMMVALGVSAYAAGIFHLMTHAFFKALLFLGAGSVIIAMHHEQNIFKMGNLKKYMPITYWTSFIGSLALIGFPGLSGFYSKEMIIEAVHLSTIPGAGYAYFAVVGGVFITALYSFRMFFLVFHTKERMDHHTQEGLRESPWVVWLPLVLLAIPSVGISWLTVEPILFEGFLGSAISVLPEHDTLNRVSEHYHGLWNYTAHAVQTLPFWLAISGIAVAWISYVQFPQISETTKKLFGPIHRLLVNKYGFDDFNQVVFAGGSRKVGGIFWRVGDVKLIDGLIVNGSALSVKTFSSWVRAIQSGYLYHYALAMIVGLALILGWLLW